MDKLEHIGIAVKNLEKSNRLFEKLLGKAPYKIEDVELEGVRTAFFDVGGMKIELLEATRANSPIANFIEKRGEGLHHLAFGVNGIEERMKELEADGFNLLSDQPRAGADNKMVVFVHPKATNHVLIELCEEKKL